MKEVREAHKEAYVSCKSLKIPDEVKSDFIVRAGFLKSFKCSCGGEMLEFDSNAFSCNSCDNLEVLKTPKPYYDFNFVPLVKCLRNCLEAMKREVESFKNTQIENENAGETLAFNDDFKIDFCFFKNNDGLKSFVKEDKNYIVFTPFESMASNKNIFFVDIYKFLSFDASGKPKVDKNMLFFLICNHLYKILVKVSEEVKSKSGNFFVKNALEFYAVKMANSGNLSKYKEVGGVEIFKSEVSKEIRYAGKHDVQNIWTKIISPRLNEL